MVSGQWSEGREHGGIWERAVFSSVVNSKASGGKLLLPDDKSVFRKEAVSESDGSRRINIDLAVVSAA